MDRRVAWHLVSSRLRHGLALQSRLLFNAAVMPAAGFALLAYLATQAQHEGRASSLTPWWDGARP